jgi:alkanesulfonate monooxygenase SsuD/methylene tetrahydromethanopterin reductase-like flavin-dependent oxidoreductase (luciferase family)
MGSLITVKFGLSLRNTGTGSSLEAIEAGAETAEHLGWETVWTTDHVLVPHSAAVEYGRTFEAIATLAWVGARHPRLKLGTSVIVVPQRNAVLLAKELATLDVLSDGRLIAGVGIGWSEGEFANLGVADRFHRRGAYLDETIRLWRHLWSGSADPFEGDFHAFRDFVFGPVPVQGERLPIVVGGALPPLHCDVPGPLATATRPPGQRPRSSPGASRSFAPLPRPPAGRCRGSPRGCRSQPNDRRGPVCRWRTPKVCVMRSGPTKA